MVAGSSPAGSANGNNMNAKRRKEIEKIVGQLEEILAEESQANDGMIDGTEAKEQSDDAISVLEDCIGVLQTI